MAVDVYFASHPSFEREIFECVRDHLESLGPIIVEPVGVGILFKRRRTFVELRPKTRWVDLSIGLNRQVVHPRVSRTTKAPSGRTYHGIRIRSAPDIDSQVREWLTESYVEFGG